MTTLETERILIRPFVFDDLEAIHRILDLDLMWAGKPLSLGQRRERLCYQIARTSDMTNNLYGDRAVVLRPSGPIIGMVHFQSRIVTAEERVVIGVEHLFRNPAINTIELDVGYALATEYQGCGYATEAVEEMIRFAFEELKIGRIFADTGQDNSRSITLMKRIGMTVVPCPRVGWESRMLGVLTNHLLG